MKTTIFTKAFAAVLVLGASLTSCDSDVFNINADPFKDQTYRNDLTLPISVYIDAEPDFSEYAKALRYSETYNALNQSTNGVSFTAFVPTNEAMEKFYESRGVAALEDLEPEYVRAFVLTHTMSDSISTEQFITKTAISNLDGETLAVTIDPENAGQAILTDNGGHQGRVIEMGLSAYNGKVYVLSQALIPLVETVKDRVNDAGSTIMMQALQATGWDKHLNTVADTIVENGRKTIIKRYYTFLNVSDQVFADAGITSFEGLKNRLAESDDRQVGVDSLLNEYVSYHVMNNAYKVSDLEGEESTSSILGSTAKNQVLGLDFNADGISLGERLVFNGAGESASLAEGKCDLLAKNGYVHNLTAWLPVWEPQQTETIWDFADYAAIKGLIDDPELYQPAVAPSKEDGMGISNASCFEYESGEGGTKNTSYSSIHYVPSKSYTRRETVDGKTEVITSTAYKNDRVVFNLGYMGWAKMQTPTLVKGKYRVELTLCYLTSQSFMRTQTEGNGGLLRISFDENEEDGTSLATFYASPYTKVPSTAAGFYTSVLCDEIESD
ncbi:MAG: fasciclin domain-containing protein, partial [Duncaniella sp.]|nr:fasciclin domain-containing protein [Duncaniella sp.]